MRALLSFLSILVLFSGCSQQSHPIIMTRATPPPAIPLAEFEQRWQAQNAEAGHPFPVRYITTHIHSNVTGIQTLQIDANPHTTNEKFMMLSFWSQTLACLFNLTDGDTVARLFERLGVGPNATFRSVSGQTSYAGFIVTRSQNAGLISLRVERGVFP
jgi:hypothetical protein